MSFTFGPRRGIYIDITEEMKKSPTTVSSDELKHFENFDLVYRSLCAILYNYVPMSGHPGGSISSGRFVQRLLFSTMDYDFSDPDRADADIISYAAGHKALGLYGMWALRNEVVRIGAPELLPKDEKYQLRLEDLLGFRRNPINKTPLFLKYKSKALDGHPTPATPFLKLSTGASGVGVAASLGLAFAALDYYGTSAPLVHLVEGEGGMTPGRVAEAFASAGTSSLGNAFIHIDWNQASIDSNNVCRDGNTPGDYVQWNPMEFAYIYDWNVIFVPDGKDYAQIAAAQKKAVEIKNGQPTAIVYRTIKGWHYGIEGRASHGAGHKLCSDGFYEAIKPLLALTGMSAEKCLTDAKRCTNDANVGEECFFEALKIVRAALEKNADTCKFLASNLKTSKDRLTRATRKPRVSAPNIEAVYDSVKKYSNSIPKELELSPGQSVTLRGELGKALNFLNKASGGSVLVAAADLLGSTSVNEIAKGFGEGYFNGKTNTASRTLSIGGICEDAIAGVLAGISTFGHHIGVGSSYGAFIAPLGHNAARLHAIGNQSRQQLKKEPYKPFILVCAHAGLKTGEDGPTHADPQCLQLLQENFAGTTAITLTPWDHQEIWPLLAAALAKRPAFIAPFVTRPNENVLDRKALGLASPLEAATGIYKLVSANGKPDGAVVIQESAVVYAFVEQALPLIKKEGLNLDVYHVSSAELFTQLPKSEQEKIFPESTADIAMGITGFTLPTMFQWIRSDYGRQMTLHPFLSILGTIQKSRISSSFDKGI
jgi:transketolase